MIGIFDSGSGGLTVLRAIRERLPSADVVYFGDIKNAPYGSRPREELSHLTVEAIGLLKERGATSIVSACNSVSASLAISLFDTLEIAPRRLIEMVGPTVAYFRGSNARIALCATPATINSGIYQNAFRMIGTEIRTYPIENLAGAIEFGGDTPEIENKIADAFPTGERGTFDILILACTHYPLVLESFTKVLGDSVALFDPAFVVAERVEKELWPREVGNGKTQYVITKDSEGFRTFVKQLFPNETHTVEVLE